MEELVSSDGDDVAATDESVSAVAGRAAAFGFGFDLDGEDDLDGVGGGAELSSSGSGLGSSNAGDSTRTVGTVVEDEGVDERGITVFGLVRAFLIALAFDSLSESLPSTTLAFEGATFFFDPDSPPAAVDVDPSVAAVNVVEGVVATAFGLSSISLISEVESFADSVTVRFELLTLETIDLPVLSGEAPAVGFFFVDRLDREPAPLMASDESLVVAKQCGAVVRSNGRVIYKKNGNCNLRILVGGLDWSSVDKEPVKFGSDHPNRLGHGFAIVDKVVFDVIVLMVPSAGLLFNSRL